MGEREITFKPYYWHRETNEHTDWETVIHIGGRTADNKSVHVKVHKFEIVVYLEIPKFEKNGSYKRRILFEHLKRILRNKAFLNEKSSYCKRSLLHYNKQVDAMKLRFKSESDSHNFKKVLNKKLIVPEIGTFFPGQLKVHECNVDAILKLTTYHDIKLAGWIKVKEFIPDYEQHLDVEERKFTTADIDLNVRYNSLEENILAVDPPENGSLISPSYCSYDIECYSFNHNSKIPDPNIIHNEIFQISMVFGFLRDDPSKREKVLLTLGNPSHEKDLKEVCDRLIILENERELLLKFTELINEYNPDIFIGYNIMKFDWSYMIRRAELRGIINKFQKMSRVVGEKAKIEELKWHSSAYGDQIFKYLECHGRLNVDVFGEIERNYKLATYSLNVVSEKFLGKNKEDVSARGLFMLYQLTLEILPKVEELRKEGITDDILKFYKKRIKKMFPVRKCGGLVKAYRKKILSCNAYDFIDVCREAMELTGKYCIQDTMLPIDLAEKLNLWTTLEETSNVTNVPMSYLGLRGQGIKVLGQIFRETHKLKIIIPVNENKGKGKKEQYEGATVFEANKGDYDNVATLDFASLYPTVMIAFNICYTTIVGEDENIKDEDCHIININTHVGCEHDPYKRNKKESEIKCFDGIYKFRKVKYSFDESGNIIRHNEGLLPKLERKLLSERKIYKKQMFKAEAKLAMHRGTATNEDIKYYKKMNWEIISKGSLSALEEKTTEISYNILNAKQLAVKVSANSMYGTLGNSNGPVPLVAGAASITCLGRNLIRMAVNKIIETYKCAKLVYGDSVANYTPVYVRRIKDGVASDIEVCAIEDLVNKYGHGWKLYSNRGIGVECKEYCEFEDVETWTDKGWTRLHRVIRHRLAKHKKMVRVLTHTGLVDVTDDHSLLKPDGLEVSPKEIEIGTELMHHRLPTNVIRGTTTQSSIDEAKVICDGTLYFEEQTQLSASRICLLAQSIGYKTYIDIRADKPNVYRITCTKSYQRKSIDVKVKKIETECLKDYDDYVYDLTTENHHFAAGIGNMIVHNTDSCMIHFRKTSLEESFKYAEESSKITTHHLKCFISGLDESYKIDNKNMYELNSSIKNFRSLTYDQKCNIMKYESCPIDLEFENMYGRFLLLTKKRYVAHSINKKAELVGVTKKGVCLSRRDNCKYLRDIYNKLTDGILNNLSEKELMYKLYDHINLLFTRQLPYSDFIITKSIGDIFKYCDNLKKVDETITDPLDERLNFQQRDTVQLTLKMMRRGENVLPNTRLEYLIIDIPDQSKNTKISEKVEDYTYFKENVRDEKLQYDKIFYITNQLAKPITEIINTKYKREMIPYVPYETEFRRHKESLISLHRCTLANIFNYQKDVGSYPEIKKYKFKNDIAKITYIIDQCKYHNTPGGITKENYPDFFEWCLLQKSKYIIEQLYNVYGLTKKKWKQSSSKNKLHIHKEQEDRLEVLMVSDYKHLKKNDKGKLVSCHDPNQDDKGKELPDKYRTNLEYDIEFNNEIIERIPRKMFTTFRIRDDDFMNDISENRIQYKKVVESIRVLSSPIIFA